MSGMVTLLGVFNILIYFGIIIFAVYFATTIIKLMREKNKTLNDIRSEIWRLNASNKKDLHK